VDSAPRDPAGLRRRGVLRIAIGWKLLQSLIEIYRSEREGPPT